MPDLNTPLSEDEVDRLSGFLDSLESPEAMNIEELDGFLCALIAGPETVMLSEYLPKVIGAEPGGSPSFDSIQQAQDIMNLLTRHWNTIAATLGAGDVYLPILLIDATNVPRGNQWAQGFMEGMDMRRGSWRHFLQDEDQAGAIVPVFALAHENHPDPKLSFPSPLPEKREEMLQVMTAGLVSIFRYFQTHRASGQFLTRQPVTRAAPETGRNDLCHCGSGKKYKHCCLKQMH